MKALYEVQMQVEWSNKGSFTTSPVTKNVIADDAEKAIVKAKKLINEKSITVFSVQRVAFVDG